MAWTPERLAAALPAMTPSLLPQVAAHLASRLDNREHLLDAYAERGYQYPQSALVVTSRWVINLHLRLASHDESAVAEQRILWSRVNSVTFTRGRGGGVFAPHVVQVHTDHEHWDIGVPFHGEVDPSPLVRVVQRIREQRDDVRSRGMNQLLAEEETEPLAGDDLLARLERLAALRRSGDLTDAEFEAAKRKILD